MPTLWSRVPRLLGDHFWRAAAAVASCRHGHRQALRYCMPFILEFVPARRLLACRQLFGEMDCTSYDWLAHPSPDSATPAAAAQVNSGPLPAGSVRSLYPTAGGNVHAFQAHTTCAMLDVLIPGYTDGAPRPPVRCCVLQQQCQMDSGLHACTHKRPPRVSSGDWLLRCERAREGAGREVTYYTAVGQPAVVDGRIVQQLAVDNSPHPQVSGTRYYGLRPSLSAPRGWF